MHYDNVESLRYKYRLVVGLNLRGVGIFHIDMIDYTDTPEGAEMRKEMFGALPPTKLGTSIQSVGELPQMDTDLLMNRYVVAEERPGDLFHAEVAL